MCAVIGAGAEGRRGRLAYVKREDSDFSVPEVYFACLCLKLISRIYLFPLKCIMKICFSL